jgi:hypothetical protein
MMNKLHVANFGPIKDGTVEFGDLTVLVGQQATGKSLVVQLVKAISDAGAIRANLKQYGFEWLKGEAVANYSTLYFGGGLQDLLTKITALSADGKALSAKGLAKPPSRVSSAETVFLVPAQRVLVLQDGWPKPFMAYLSGDPYSMRRFSDALRTVMDDFSVDAPVFPQPNKLMSTLRTAIDRSIYAGFELRMETQGQRKQLLLTPRGGVAGLPLNAWSAGQREFTPLLFSLYWLMPPSKVSRRGDLDHVIIEEPEMGLHPQAIVSFMLIVLSLLHRGYRVTLSTHSPVVLDVVWAVSNLRDLKRADAVSALRKIFELPAKDAQIRGTLETALQKSYRTYFFERKVGEVTIQDISTLDPGANDENVNGWGGLSGFSGRIADIVGDARTKAGVA